MNSYTTTTYAVVIWKEHDCPRGHVIPIHFKCHSKKQKRLLFSGSIPLDQNLKQHIRRNLVSLLDQICQLLGLQPTSFEIITNTPDELALIKPVITGHSADLPLLLGMLSAATKQAIDPSVASTGRISTKHGELHPIEDWETKLQTAYDHPVIEKIISPNIAPESPPIKVCEIKTLLDAIKHAFTEAFEGSLKQGYFNTHLPEPSTPAEQIASFLGCGNLDAYLSRLRLWLQRSQYQIATELITTFTQHHQQTEKYPSRFGSKLAHTFRLLDPNIQKELQAKPILAKEMVLALAKLAETKDFEDLNKLMEIAQGTFSVTPKKIGTKLGSSGEMNIILDACSPRNLAQKIGIPLDEARLTFHMESIKVRSHAQFVNTITAFYIHTLEQLGELGADYKKEQMAKNAHSWVEEAFHKQGGFTAALSEAKSPMQGGTRFILDWLIDYEKSKRMREYVDYLLKTEVDIRGFKYRTAFIKCFFSRYQAYLPSEIKSQPPERYTNQFQSIIKTYIQSQTTFENHIRSL